MISQPNFRHLQDKKSIDIECKDFILCSTRIEATECSKYHNNGKIKYDVIFCQYSVIVQFFDSVIIILLNGSPRRPIHANITFSSEVAKFVTYKGFGQKLGNQPNNTLNFGHYFAHGG